MSFIKTTEKSSNYNNLELMNTHELLTNMNQEDLSVPLAVKAVIPKIGRLVDVITVKLNKGGRLFYMGAGTSGRLGILDASECPPTFGVPHNLVIGIIAGGDTAIRKAVEFAEDSKTQGWEDLNAYNISDKDVVIGIAASGTTPYVIEALIACNSKNITTGCITCNEGSPLGKVSNYPIEVVVGPEFVTGSSRLKAGTAQKLVLNMISTATMIKLGKVKGNKMVDMQLSNDKLVERGTNMIMAEINVNSETAKQLLLEHKSVRKAIEKYNTNGTKTH
ncbi:MAG: N-acetylmuramic acid 6-phosphate etherase [Bacteroidetes bacterium MedPE-SWsnd-G2]|nr:MAG: N-acetylmuramic acid 6-phosphate etherase [Bacteroidetes bacterium MedPE-SWsnd-G2]